MGKPELAIVALSNAWNELCPRADKGFINKLIEEMKADGQRDFREICKAATGRLYDGLAYGNWPSVLPHRRSKAMPQSSDEMRALMTKWFGSIMDNGPVRLLESHDFELTKAFYWLPPVPAHTVSSIEADCIRFLIEEWDYGFLLKWEGRAG